MSGTIRLPEELLNQAKLHSSFYHRSTTKQIEFWANIGRIAEENPDLTYDMIKGIMLGLQEIQHDLVEEYTFDA